ncbi:MAG TPA: MFS transporter [Ktedonobacterales bacterium]
MRKGTGSRPLYALFTASLISYTGSVLTLLAIPWFVLQSTGSVAQTGITAFFSTLPLVISALLGTSIVDRLGFTRSSVASDIVSGVSVACIPLLADTIGLAFWQLLVFVFVAGLLKSPGGTARSSLLPDLADRAKMRRERANAIADGVSRIAGFLGAPLAALLITFIGTKNLLWLDAASFFISASVIGLLVPVTRATAVSAVNESRYLRHLQQGVGFMLRDPVLLALMSTILVTNLLDQGLSAVVAPAYIKQVFHSPLPMGWMYGAFGGAAFAGALIFAAIGHRLPRRWTLGVGSTIGGATRFWILLVPVLPLIIAVYAMAGVGAAPTNPLIDTILQEHVSPDMRARVFGTTTAVAYIGIPLGAVLGGVLVTWIGIRDALLVMGAIYAVTTLSLLINPALQAMDR